MALGGHSFAAPGVGMFGRSLDFGGKQTNKRFVIYPPLLQQKNGDRHMVRRSLL